MALAMIGSMFGINGDGKMSCVEKVIGYGFGDSAWRRRRGAGAEQFASRAHRGGRNVWAAEADAAAQDEVFLAVGRSVQLIIAGLNENTLRDMDAAARCEALEGAGLDPDAFDYLDL